ncbi:hypothetical protein BO78DRAFT_414186 [Aspergillus sclerotiicarbonarius CBS 121057]|uniref:Uncharacterized protein n=1 Tax=Aspergillus sclerotiicarbonarius (strain CBS 121057 / IBT 28362) TaxID=1448318 RepID=A0A319ELB4_ASPSB|nr:hypothetical protein BO78DRAFT_414186 [Aspergillus sclerotiicarbonarius CBS 121057]
MRLLEPFSGFPSFAPPQPDHALVLRSDIEKHLQDAPAPIPAHVPKDLTRPKKYHNYDRAIPRSGYYTEYPTMDYPYQNQSAKTGKAYKTVRTKKGKLMNMRVSSGCTRTITDPDKQIQGVLSFITLLQSIRRGRRVIDLHPAQEVFRSRTFGPPVSSG